MPKFWLNSTLSSRASRLPSGHRIRWPDGSLHWLEITGSLQREADGRPRMFGVIRDISAQQERAEALRASEERFASLFRLSPDIMLLVRYDNSEILEANQHFTQAFGWPAAEILGRSTLDLDLWVHAEQRDHLRQQAPLSREPVIQEVQLRTRDGDILDGVLSSQYIELQGERLMLCTFLDTSERKRAENALRASEEKFAKAFMHTPDAVTITDRATGRFIEVNPSFEQQFGWSSAEAVGRTSLELGIWVDPSDRQRMLDAAQIGRLNNLEVRLLSRNGSVTSNLLFGGEIELNGTTCLVLTVRNITEQRAQEQATTPAPGPGIRRSRHLGLAYPQQPADRQCAGVTTPGAGGSNLRRRLPRFLLQSTDGGSTQPAPELPKPGRRTPQPLSDHLSRTAGKWRPALSRKHRQAAV